MTGVGTMNREGTLEGEGEGEGEGERKGNTADVKHPELPQVVLCDQKRIERIVCERSIAG